MNSRTLEKYLDKTKNALIEPMAPQQRFRAAVVIPALAEFDSLPLALHSLALNPAPELTNTMVLIVVNSSRQTPPDKRIDNRKTLAALRGRDIRFAGGLRHGENLFWIDAEQDDRQIGKNGGVGEARKTGMDCALNFLGRRDSPGPALLLCLDADTLVEDNYLAAIFACFDNNPELVAATIDFSHQRGATPETEHAIRLYEQFMRYYRQGLRWAGSPYAFHALGSAIVATSAGYVGCGGMRPRNGGEDFYFLQAVRKIGMIGEISNTTVHPAARLSDRVPFGTGPRLRDIVNGNERLFYHPRVFGELKTVIRTVEDIDTVEGFARLPALLCRSETAPFASFTRNAFPAVWSRIHANTRKEIPQLRRAFHTWLDAFRTLKFIRFCEQSMPDTQRLSAAEARDCSRISPLL